MCRFAPVSMDRQMGERLCYNFAAGSFHNFAADYSVEIEIEFYLNQ